MTRPAPARVRACLLAAVAVAAGTLVAGPTPPASAAAEDGRTPLRVSVETLAPATIPEHGRVTMTGEITNRSDVTWTNLKAYLMISPAPLTSRSELADAAASDASAPVGERRTSLGLYDEVGDLAPGESVPYQVSVRRQDLEISGEPGVYWVGVHVLGAEDGVRDLVADGRARTFMPLLTDEVVRQGARTRLSLVVPIKAEVRRGAAGRLLGARRWQRALSPDGRLDRLLGLSARGDHAMTWVVDPAVLDAAASVARDNPGITSESTAGPGATTSPSGSAGPSETPSPPEGSGTGQDDQATEEPTPEAVAARAWLDEFRRQAPLHSVTTVPYGDLDVASVLDSRLRDLFEQATELSRDAMDGYGLTRASAVVDPTSGVLPGTALRRIDPGVPTLLSDEAFPDRSPSASPVLRYDGRAPVVLSDSAAGSGGPKPNSRYAALAVRQRMLSAAALHALSDDRDEPMVVSMPPYWNPGKAWLESNFFGGLDQPWLQLVDLPTVASTAPLSSGDPARPSYPRKDRKAQVPFANLLATQQLDRTGTTYSDLLTDNDTIDDFLRRIGMLASSHTARDTPVRALDQATSTTDYVRSQMLHVRVEGPPFVMMSSESGPIQVKLVNDLDEPVTVGVEAQSRSAGLTLSTPDPVTLGPGEQTAVRLEATSDDIGVHAVTISATTQSGTPIGSLTQFSVRTSHVGTVIWLIIGLGGAALLLAILVRLVRRLRRRRARAAAGPEGQTAAGAVGDPTDPSGPHERPGQEVR